MNIYESFENFISYIKHEENLSVNTVKAYHRDVSSFLDYLAKQKIENVKDINTLNIRSYLLTIHNKLDKVSVSRVTSSIRSFL
jgi:site-specific recombinase XerD